MVQKTIIDTPHKEGKSQRVITERGGCSKECLSNHINAKLTWRKQQGWPQAWEYCQAKPDQTLGRASQGVNWSWSQCIKSHHCSDIFRKRVTKHFWNRNISQKHLTWAKEKKNWTFAQWSKVLFSDESQFCILFGNQGPRVWRKRWRGHRIHVAWGPVWSFHSQWWFRAAMSSAGVGPPVFSEVHSQRSIYQDILEHFMLPSADKLYGDAWFNFPAGLITCPHCQRYQKLVQWPWCYCAWLASKTHLTWTP